jgi:hypothetical protein
MWMLMGTDTSRTAIRTANDHVAAGRKEEAKRILQELFERQPGEKRLYADAVNIYLAARMFEEAKAVFDVYKKRFGEELRTDFDLADIEREQNSYVTAAKTYQSTPVKIFKRMSAFERGRLSNLPTFFPVREIRLSDDEIVLKKGGKEYHYTWSDIHDAFITKRKGYKGYVFGEEVIRTLNLRTKDRIFQIDVSTKFPDLKDTEILLDELRKKITLRDD